MSNLVHHVSDRDLFSNFERMRRDMDELLGDVFDRSGMRRRRSGFSPPIDVSYTTEPPVAVVTVELAGVDPNQVDIEVQGRQLTIAGQRQPSASEECVYQQVEIERGRFRRVVALPGEVEGQRVTASYQAGMLRIELPLVRRQAGATAVPIESPPRQ